MKANPPCENKALSYNTGSVFGIVLCGQSCFFFVFVFAKFTSYNCAAYADSDQDHHQKKIGQKTVKKCYHKNLPLDIEISA